MLVLSRKVKQGIIIGENIELVVVAVSGDRVKLGFNAPSDVHINREEIHRRIQSLNGRASTTPAITRAK
jgi:carbon storage regulator